MMPHSSDLTKSAEPVTVQAQNNTIVVLLLPSLLAIAIPALLSGCGSGSSSPSNAPMRTPPVTPKQGAVPIPKNKTNDDVQPINRKSDKIKVAQEDRDDVFNASPQGNFSLMGLTEKNLWRQSHEQTASVPLGGKNSTEFIIANQPEFQPAAPETPVTLPANFIEIPEAGYDASGYPKKILCEVDKSVMVFIPAGVFIQGKDDADPNASPAHSHYLDSYYIDEHEVTVKSFLAFRDYQISLKKRSAQIPYNAEKDPNEPALGILWRDASGYAKQVGKTLPTEAEWEKAARGEAGFDHPWGFGRAAWQKSRTVNKLSPVMSYPTDKSPYGVFDMAGNAREWVADWYQDDTYQQLAKKSSNKVLHNDKGPRKAKPKSHHVVKGAGGNWMLWHRASRSMVERDNRIGFRCVLRIKTTPVEN